MIGRRFRKPASNHHAITVAEFSVANDTIDLKPILPAVDQVFCNRDRKLIYVIRKASDQSIAACIGGCLNRSIRVRICDLACIESLIVMELSTSNRSSYRVARSTIICEKIA